MGTFKDKRRIRYKQQRKDKQHELLGFSSTMRKVFNWCKFSIGAWRNKKDFEKIKGKTNKNRRRKKDNRKNIIGRVLKKHGTKNK